jgi:hypothetical protein
VAEREHGPELDPELDADLAELVAAYRTIEPPCPLDQLSRPDRQTQAALDWLATSWRALEPRAAVLLPFVLRLRGRAVQAALRGLAAAGILLALFTLAFLRPGTRSSIPAGPADSAGPRIAAISRDLTEIRSGPVRLILFSDRQNRQNP